MSYLAKIIYNKKNKQAVVSLSKKKLSILKKKKCKYLRIKEEDLI